MQPGPSLAPVAFSEGGTPVTVPRATGGVY